MMMMHGLIIAKVKLSVSKSLARMDQLSEKRTDMNSVNEEGARSKSKRTMTIMIINTAFNMKLF